MTDDDDLKKLFERTANEPSSFELTRMAARARELPTRLERVPRRLPRWTWGHAFAALAALGALGVALTEVPPDERPSPPERHEPAPIALAPRASSEPSARAEPSPLTSAPIPATDDDVDLDALSFGSDLDDDPFDLSSAEEMELSK